MARKLVALAREEAATKLRTWLAPGDTVYTILRHASRSRMRREIGVVIIPADGSGPLHPNYLAGEVTGARVNKRGDGVVMGGCGTDMGWEIVYNLGRALWPEGFGCVGERCRSNDHSNGDRDRTPHGGHRKSGPGAGQREHWHRDGGYALQQVWL